MDLLPVKDMERSGHGFFSSYCNAGSGKTIAKPCVGNRSADCVFTSFVCCHQNLQEASQSLDYYNYYSKKRNNHLAINKFL